MVESIDAQYERIVGLIPADELKSGYNNELHDDISSVIYALDDVVAAFSCLKEVRDAVHKLHQDEVQCNSPSLLKIMHDICILQQDLEVKLHQVIQEEIGKKTKPDSRHESSSSNESESSPRSFDIRSSSEGEEVILSVQGQSIKDEKQSEVWCAGGSSTSHKSLESGEQDDSTNMRTLILLPTEETAWTNVTIKDNKRVEGETRTHFAKTSMEYVEMVTNVARMSILERCTHVRSVLLELTETVNNNGTKALKEEHALVIVEHVVKWLEEDTDRRVLLDVYQHFLAMMMTFEGQVVDARTKVSLKRSMTTISCILKDVASQNIAKEKLAKPATSVQEYKALMLTEKSTASSRCNATVTRKAPPQLSGFASNQNRVPPVIEPPVQTSIHPCNHTAIIHNLQQTSMQRRIQCIPFVLSLLKQTMEHDVIGHQVWQIPNSVDQVMEWILKGTNVWHDYGMYQKFARTLTSYAAKHVQSERLQRIACRFSDIAFHSSATAAWSPGVPYTRQFVSTHQVSPALVERRMSETMPPSFCAQTRFCCLVRSLEAQPCEVRSKRIPEVVLAFKADRLDARHLAEVTQAMTTVEQWVRNDPFKPSLLESYWSLLKEVDSFINHCEPCASIVELRRLSTAISLLLRSSERSNEPTLDEKCEIRPKPPLCQAPNSHESESESDSDFEDVKEVEGGSEAAWAVLTAAGTPESSF